MTMRIVFVVTFLFDLVVNIYAVDPLRPQFHLMPIQYWLNDPNGPVYYNGYYHMFYQHNPHAPVWGDMHWGHSYSTDMVHWIHLPIALAPDQTYDQNGIFTGSTTIVNGIPLIIYTGITNENTQVQCLAHPSNLSDPTLTNWTKSPLNPLIRQPNGRDPSSAFRHSDGNYYLIYGYGDGDLGGQAVLFTSNDFLNWTYLHPIHHNHYDQFWECPDIFNVSNQIVLKASLLGRDFWSLGILNSSTMSFTPIDGDLGEFRQLVDYGHFYASKSFYDPLNDRQVIVGWISEEDDRGAQRGWQGLHSIPREIFLSDDGLEIRSKPIEAMNSLRIESSHRILLDLHLFQPTFELLPDDFRGNQVEIRVNWQFPIAQNLNFGLAVLSTPTGTQRTDLGILSRENTTLMFNTDLPGWDYFSVTNITNSNDCQSACNNDRICQSWTFVSNRPLNNNCFLKSGVPFLVANSVCTSGVKQRQSDQQLIWFYVNRTLSETNPQANRGIVHAPIWMQSSSFTDRWFLELQIYLDHSVIEIFDNQYGRIALSTRIYPENTVDGDHLAVYLSENSSDKEIIFNSVDFWSMESL